MSLRKLKKCLNGRGGKRGKRIRAVLRLEFANPNNKSITTMFPKNVYKGLQILGVLK